MLDISGVLQPLPGFLQIINVIVLLSALFFFTSTISSHLIEVFAGFINSRGKQLRARLELALGKDAAKALYDDPIIKSLSNQSRTKIHPPSYIEPELFARVAASLSNDDKSAMSRSEVIKDIKDKLMKVESDLEPKLIEWFKAITGRQTGVYTRWTFLRLLVIGFMLASLLDIDTVHIAAELWRNPEQAEQAARVLDEARQISDHGESLTDADKKRLQESVAKAYAQLRTIVPPNYAWQTPPGKIKNWPGKLLGWLLTALATSLGAQFWFNIMSDSLKLRAAGRKPADDPKKPDGEEKPNGAVS
jgi:hypothetical protein